MVAFPRKMKGEADASCLNLTKRQTKSQLLTSWQRWWLLAWPGNVAIQGALRDSEDLRCLLFVATAFFERFADELPFSAGERCADGDGQSGRRRRGGRAGWTWVQHHKRKAADHVIGGCGQRGLNDVLQFAHIAWPRMGEQLLHRRRGDGANLFLHPCSVFLEQAVRQQWNVGEPVA